MSRYSTNLQADLQMKIKAHAQKMSSRLDRHRVAYAKSNASHTVDFCGGCLVKWEPLTFEIICWWRLRALSLQLANHTPSCPLTSSNSQSTLCTGIVSQTNPPTDQCGLLHLAVLPEFILPTSYTYWDHHTRELARVLIRFQLYLASTPGL